MGYSLGLCITHWSVHHWSIHFQPTGHRIPSYVLYLGQMKQLLPWHIPYISPHGPPRQPMWRLHILYNNHPTTFMCIEYLQQCEIQQFHVKQYLQHFLYIVVSQHVPFMEHFFSLGTFNHRIKSNPGNFHTPRVGWPPGKPSKNRICMNGLFWSTCFFCVFLW